MTFQVRRAMTTEIVTVNPATTVDDACALLLQHRISGLPVVDDAGEIVGIVSERDFLSLLTDPDCQSHRVADYMQRDVLTIREDDRLTEVVELFQNNAIRRIPVVRGRSLVGVLSRHDVIRFIRRLRERVGGVLQQKPLKFKSQQAIAEYCGVARSVIQRRMRSGDCPADKRDGYYLLTKDQLTAVSVAN